MLRQLFVLFPLILVACARPDETPPGADDQPDAAYEMRGVVQSVTADSVYLTVSHEAVEGYMDAMTMSFVVADTAELPRVVPGDTVAFTLRAGPDGDRIHSLRRTVE